MVLNPKFVLIIISFVFVVNTQFFNTVFDIGNYPNHKKYGINSPTCGLRYPPTVHNITYKPECFQHNYSDQTFYEINNIRYDVNVRTQPKGRIFRGQDAESGEAPWAVFIGVKQMRIKYFTVLTCTGSLITLEWVLTAAHCRMSNDPNVGSFVVIGGPSFKSSWFYTEGVHRENAKWIAHPNYDNPSLVTNSTDQDQLEKIKELYDVSLMKLNKPLPKYSVSGSYHINTVCLPSRNPSRRFPFKTTNFGYGHIESSGLGITNDMPSRLQKAEYSVSNESLGLYTIEHKSKDEPKTCKGDSGSGIVYYMDEYKTRAAIVGTLLGGMKISEWWNIKSDCRAVELDYTFFVPTYKFIDFILDTIANN